MELYKYQRDILNELVKKYKSKTKLCLQLATSGGKTFVFSHLTKYWSGKYGCRVLVLCHREELVHQAIEEMNRLGVTCEAVFPSVKRLKHNSQCYVGMIETIDRRLKRNPNFFNNVGLVIADEAHVQIFSKVYGYFTGAKILGVTATPVVMKRVTFYRCKWCKSNYNELTTCCNMETDEWTKPFSLSSIYEDIVIGPSINTLIDEYGSLVRDLTFVDNYADTDSLKIDVDGEFTSESLDKVYSNDGASFNCLLNYEKRCLGKKTIIFNSSSRSNLMVYKKFIEAGHNARMYDSVNVEESGCRKELVKWFRESDDAVLLNVGCFIAGFSEKEVQAIITNTAVGSLSAYIQMLGRGARITDKIFKEYFIHIDGGGNTARHLEFSDPTRDWERIFWEGIGKERSKKQDAMDIQSCDDCGALYLKSEPSCPECGGIILPPEPKALKEETLSNDVLMPIRKIPPPRAESIYKFTIKRGENINFAHKILLNYIMDMFIFYRVDADTYAKTKLNGNLVKTVSDLIRPTYFYLLNKKDIQTEGRRTIKNLTNRIIEKLDKYYDI